MNFITIEQASELLSTAMRTARSAGYKAMGIVVLDVSGNIKACAIEDGASMFRFDIARAKAWGAIGMGVSSRALGQRAKDNPNFFLSLASTAAGKFLPQTGAVLIKNAAGEILGAAGASGGTGDEDEAICMAGIQASRMPRVKSWVQWEPVEDQGMRTSSFVRQQLSLWVFNGLKARLTLAQEASSAQWHGGQKHKSDQAGRIAFVAPSMVCAALNDAVTLLHQDLLVIQDCVNLTSHNHSIVNGVGLVHPGVFFCKVPTRIDTHAVKVGLCIHGC